MTSGIVKHNEDGSVTVLLDPKDAFSEPFKGSVPNPDRSALKTELKRTTAWRMGSRVPRHPDRDSSETQED
jgi:acylphosphatase